MGLIKAALGATGGVLADSWKDFIYCDSLSPDVLVAKGKKRAGKRSSNTKGDDNIITDGSVIAINEGQCMIIVETGKIVEFCAEPGEFTYNSATEPSLFSGGLGAGISNTFRQIGKRFAFGGGTYADQRVYFFNIKEITGNKYGTANPVPFRVVHESAGIDLDISIRCNGEYSYRIVDPILFYTNVTGNVDSAYTRGQIDSMLKTELLTALQPAFAKISDKGIRYSSLPGHTLEISDALNEVLSQKWKELRGLVVASFGVNSVSASKEDEDMIKQMQKASSMRDPNLAAANLVSAQADAMRAAAANTGGAMAGFMGMGMAQSAGGVNAQALFNMGAQQQQQQTRPSDSTGWLCPCGATNKGRFCSECGKPKPAGAPLYRCDKCGWQPADPTKPPKFCPECGDPFDENDIA